MGVRALKDDEELVPLEQPPATPRSKVRSVRPLSDADTFVPLGAKQPSVLPPHEPTLAETLFGREDPTGTANVEGVLPSLGRDLATTGKQIGSGLAEGAVNAADVALTAQKPLLDWYLQRNQEQRDVGQRQQEELLGSARDMYAPPTESTPVGDVLGGLAQIAAPLAAGGVPGLVASETLHRGKELTDQGIDLETARAAAVTRGAATAVGARLPILGKTLPSRLLTGGIGNALYSTASEFAEKKELEAGAPKLSPEEQQLVGDSFEGSEPPTASQRQAIAKEGRREHYLELADAIHPLDPSQKAIDLLTGAAFGGLHHALAAPGEAIARQDTAHANEAWRLNEAADEAWQQQNEADAAARAAQANAPKQLPRPGVTIEGELDTGPPALEAKPENRTGPQQVRPEGQRAGDQDLATSLGLTPDVVDNLARLEEKAKNDRAGRVLPPPDTTLQVGPSGEARAVTDVEEQARQERRERDYSDYAAALTRKAQERSNAEVGLTPDVQANLERLKARGAVGASVPPVPALPRPIGDELAPQRSTQPTGGSVTPAEPATADQGVSTPPSAESTVQTPKTGIVRPLREGEAVTPLEGGASTTGRAPASQGQKSRKIAKPASVLEHLANEGGLSIEALEKEGIDRADMRGVKGFKRPFTKKGMSLDSAAETLHQAGYDVADEAGRPDANKALQLIDDEVRGKKHYAKGAQLEAPEPVDKRSGTELRTAAERRAPPPRETPERRAPAERRKPVAQMTPEEMRHALTTSDKTGLPNRRAYEEKGLDQKPHQASIDLDSFKWFNDEFSHETGDEVLRAIGEAFKATGVDVHHMSGDEFAIGADKEQDIHDAMETLREAASKLEFELTNPDGEKWTVDGVGVSYGVGPSLKEADANLQSDKDRRAETGERSRGGKPAGANRAGSEIREGQDESYGRESEARQERRAADRGDVEHVTLEGEKHAATTERGAGAHHEIGEHVGPEPEHGIEQDSNELADALKAAHNNGSDANHSRVRRLMMRFEMTHGEQELSDLIDRLDKEMDIEDLGKTELDQIPEPAKKPAAAKPPAQGDLFTKADARPDANAKQIARSNALLKELEEATTSNEEGDIKTLAIAFNREFREDHTASLVGKSVQSTNDLATLSEIFRNPKFETLRYFMVKGGKIVGQTGVSSRLPGSGAAFPTGEDFDWIRRFVDKYSGGQLYMQHNHPSGNAMPSTTDVAFTQNVAKKFGIRVQHIVVDHDHYGRMIVLPDGTIASNEKVAIPAKMGHEDPLHVPQKPHTLLGRQVVGPGSLVQIAKMLEQKEGYLTVIGTGGAASKVRTLGDMPAHLFNNPERLKQQLRRFGVQNGAGRLFIAGMDPAYFRSAENRKLLNELQYDQYATDFVDHDGFSFSGESGSIIVHGDRDYGINPHEVSREVKPREPGEPPPARAPKREEKQTDLLGDDVETKNKLAAAQRTKDTKRSPNKDVAANTGAGGDLFTTSKQGELIREHMSEDDFIRKEKKGDIPSHAYEQHNKDLSWLGAPEKYPEHVRTFEAKDGAEIELRKSGEKLKYVKHDDAGEIERKPDGDAVMMSDEEIAAGGHATHDQTIVAFEGDKPVGFASNEFGTTGVFVQDGYQRKGIGTELLAQFRKENPKIPLGQMTPAGENLARKAYSSGRIEESRGRYGAERRSTEERRRRERGGRREDDSERSQKGDKGYAAVAQKAIDAWNKKIGWRYGPLGRLPDQKSYLEERYKALGAVKAGQEIGRETYDALRKATPEDATAVYEYLTNKHGDPTAIADPEVRAVAKRTKALIDKIGQRLVDTGLLSQEAYDEHAGEYLPRLYLKHVLGDGVMKAIGSGKRLSDLGYLKRRQDIPEEVRKVILGEITDPAFLASFGISRTMRDLALVDFLHAIAGRELWTPKHSTVEWRGRQVTPFYLADEARALRRRAQLYTDPKAKAAALKMADEAQAVADEGLAKLEARPDPNDFEQIPNSKRYGALRGLYVRKEIYGDLVGAQQWIPANSSVAEALLGSGGLAARAQSWWKLSKVILNPPTQVRNFVANMMLLHLSGVPFHRVYSGEIIGKAINSLANKDRFYEIAKKYGLFAATFANNEGARIRDEWLALQDMKGGGLAKMKAFAARGVNVASDFYQLMEAIGKIAKIRDAIEREGKSPADAVLEAHEALFDYSLVPRSVQYLRNAPIGAPFITFAYKAAAQMAKIAVKHPARFAPYAAIPFLMAALIKSSYDVTDDDLKKLKTAFPQWMKERGHMLLLPYKDALGRWQNVDMGYLTPWGQFADMAAQMKEGEGAGKLAGSLVFSGPMMDVANALQTNVDPFTGKPIVDDRDPPADKLQAMMQYAWNLAAPGWLTEQGALNQLAKSVAGKNVNKRTGEPGMTPTQASLRLLGLNIYPADPAATRAQNLRSMRANLEESKARASSLLNNKNLSDSERDNIRETWRKLLEARGKEIEQYSRDSEINPKLE